MADGRLRELPLACLLVHELSLGCELPLQTFVVKQLEARRQNGYADDAVDDAQGSDEGKGDVECPE